MANQNEEGPNLRVFQPDPEPDLSPRIADLMDRVLALVIDGFLLTFIVAALGTLIGQKVVDPGDFDFEKMVRSELTSPWVFLLKCAALVLFYGLFEGLMKMTPGKKVMGLIVTDLHGRPITFGRAMLRAGLRILSIGVGFGYLMALFTDKNQGLHDYLAGTLVLDQEKKPAKQSRNPRKKKG